jgi:hypothetical protein
MVVVMTLIDIDEVLMMLLCSRAPGVLLPQKETPNMSVPPGLQFIPLPFEDDYRDLSSRLEEGVIADEGMTELAIQVHILLLTMVVISATMNSLHGDYGHDEQPRGD